MNNNIEKYMMASYVDNKITHAPKLIQFTKFALSNFKELVKGKLDDYLGLKHKEKIEFIETILASMMERDPEYRGDEFKIQEINDLLKARVPLVFALLNLYHEENGAQ